MLTDTHFFLGANTPQGFYSLYDELYNDTGMLYILKGGAGCGKSSFMRTVAEQAGGVEYIHCSGDPDSLDAVIMRDVTITDGTAPHVAEPRVPAVNELYIDLGAYYDSSALRENGEKIRNLISMYKERYVCAYRLLAAAGSIYDQLLETVETPEFLAKAERRSRGIIQRELPRQSGRQGHIFRRFLSAISCQGEVTFYQTINALATRVFELSDGLGISHWLLKPIAQAAVLRGLDIVECLDPLRPDRLKHLIIPELSLAFITLPPRNECPIDSVRRVRIENMSSACRLPETKMLLKRLELLKSDAIDVLAQAKALHDKLEDAYNPHVDFESVYLRARRLIAEIN